MTDPEQPDLIAELAAELGPLMRGVLASEDVREASDLVGEAQWHCLEPLYSEHLRDAGNLYAVWAEIDDILDGWPFDYGSDAEAIAMREFKQAAKEWLDMPRTETGITDYVARWKTRMAKDNWPAPGGVHWRQRLTLPADRHDPCRPDH